MRAARRQVGEVEVRGNRERMWQCQVGAVRAPKPFAVSLGMLKEGLKFEGFTSLNLGR